MILAYRPFLAALSLLSLFTGFARAQENTAAAAPQEGFVAEQRGAEAASSAVATQPSTGTAPAAAPSDDVHVRRVLVELAESERSARYASAYSMFIGAAAAVSVGLVADTVYDRSYGRVLWIVGAITGVGGLANLFIARPFERMAVEADGWTLSQLQSEWGRRADASRQARKVGGVVGLGLGALLVGGGAAVAAGLGSMELEDKHFWTSTLIVLGGAIAGGGVTSLLVESPFEWSYRMAFGNKPDDPGKLTLRVAPTWGGAALSVSSRF